MRFKILRNDILPPCLALERKRYDLPRGRDGKNASPPSHNEKLLQSIPLIRNITPFKRGYAITKVKS